MSRLIYSLIGEDNLNPLVEKYQSNTYIFSYPCNSRYECSPYKVVLSKGTFKIECYGAGRVIGGGYTSGILCVEDKLTIYLYLGGLSTFPTNDDNNLNYVFNGGGAGNIQSSSEGNGATDVRLSYNKDWSDFNSLKSRIMVAGGSGGSECGYGGVGGGIIGGDGQAGNCTIYYDKGGFGGTNTKGGYGNINGSFGYAQTYSSSSSKAN